MERGRETDCEGKKDRWKDRDRKINRDTNTKVMWGKGRARKRHKE